jgi:flagellar protein FlaG
MRIEMNGSTTVQPVAPAQRTRAAEADPAQATARATESAGRTAADVDKTLGLLDDELKSFDISLRFRRDEESKAVIIELFDRHTGEKVRQIPTEASLHLSKVLGSLKGVVIDSLA